MADENKKLVKFVRASNDKTRVRMITEDAVLLAKVAQNFTVKNPAHRFYKFAPEFLCQISALGTFNSGLFFDVLTAIKSFNKNIEIDYSAVLDIIMPFSHQLTKEQLVQPENDFFKYRDYQEEGIIKAILYGRGSFGLPTGSGKSLVIYGLIKNLWALKGKVRILVLVPGIQLVDQMYKDFCEYGCDPNDILRFTAERDREIDFDKYIIVSNREYLIRSGRHEEIPSDLHTVIVDECHQIGKNKITQVIKKWNCNSVYGFTGSFPQEIFDLWNVVGITGKIHLNIPPKDFQEQGHICDVDITCIQVDHGCKQPVPQGKNLPQPGTIEYAKLIYPTEYQFVEGNVRSNILYAKFAKSLSGNTIILYDHVQHGNNIVSCLNVLNKDKKHIIYEVNGEVELDTREDIRKDMELQNNVILVANCACFKQGINIKNIRNICFVFCAGKKSSKILQAVGRGLRMMSDKTTIKLYDFYANFKYSKQHFAERLKLYRQSYKIKKLEFKSFNL